MRALFLLATAATAFQPKTTQKPTTKLQAKVGDALGAGRQRFCCGLAPLDPPAPGTEFMHPLLLSGAAKTLREAGAAAIVVDDPVAVVVPLVADLTSARPDAAVAVVAGLSALDDPIATLGIYSGTVRRAAVAVVCITVITCFTRLKDAIPVANRWQL
mgnify:CR=1 FL=1